MTRTSNKIKDEKVKKSERKAGGGRLFSSEYQPNNKCGGRPTQEFSYRAMAKARAKKDPKRVQTDLDKLDEIIDSKDASPAEIMKAIEYKIRLNGGFDPVENRDVTEKEVYNPFDNLTEAELRKLAKEK